MCVLCARLYSVVEIVVRSGEVACCSVVCGTLVGVPVFSMMCSELLIILEISCPLWSSVCEYRVWYVGDVLYAVCVHGVVMW